MSRRARATWSSGPHGTEAVPIAELERIKPRTVVSIVMAAMALGTLIPQFLGVGSVWGELRNADLWWAAAALGLSVVTYIGAAVALDGSVPERLPLAPNIGVQMATSFVGVAAPGGALALTARFLQKRGIDTATAVAAVGVDTLAGVIVHLTLTGLFFALAGSSGLHTFDLPSLFALGMIGAGIALLAAVGVAVPWSRSLLATRVLPATKRSLASVGDIARQPSKMVELFGGSLAITMGYILALGGRGVGVRRRPGVHLDRAGVPRRRGGVLHRSDARRDRCRRGDADRRAHISRHVQHHRGRGGHPVPPRDVLDPAAAGVGRARRAAALRRSLTGG